MLRLGEKCKLLIIDTSWGAVLDKRPNWGKKTESFPKLLKSKSEAYPGPESS